MFRSVYAARCHVNTILGHLQFHYSSDTIAETTCPKTGVVPKCLPTQDNAVHLVDVGQLGKCSSLDRRNPPVCALLLRPVRCV